MKDALSQLMLTDKITKHDLQMILNLLNDNGSVNEVFSIDELSVIRHEATYPEFRELLNFWIANYSKPGTGKLYKVLMLIQKLKDRCLLVTPFQCWQNSYHGFTKYGSFRTNLYKAYACADNENTDILNAAYPEYFREYIINPLID